MLEKIGNSLIYGNTRTKIFLWSIILMVSAAAIMLLMAVIFGIPFLGMGGCGMGIMGFITSQSVSLEELQKKKEQPKEKKEKSNILDKGILEQGANHKEETSVEEQIRVKKEKEKQKAQYLAGFDAKKLKKEMKKHKVNQIHVKVMIDSFPLRNIEQAPAFMWRTDTMLHFMILEGETKEIEVPLDQIQNIMLVKNVPVDPERDYFTFKYSSYISKMFQPYLPEYFQGTREGKLEVKKNTFRIEPGIYLTNSSVANLRKVLLPGVAFLVDDAVTASRHFNEYFKELYRESLLCKNLVVTLEEYREQVEKTLTALLDAPISGSEFVDTLRNLKKYHLITDGDVTSYSQKYRAMNLNKNGR